MVMVTICQGTVYGWLEGIIPDTIARIMRIGTFQVAIYQGLVNAIITYTRAKMGKYQGWLRGTRANGMQKDTYQVSGPGI